MALLTPVDQVRPGTGGHSHDGDSGVFQLTSEEVAAPVNEDCDVVPPPLQALGQHTELPLRAAGAEVVDYQGRPEAVHVLTPACWLRPATGTW